MRQAFGLLLLGILPFWQAHGEGDVRMESCQVYSKLAGQIMDLRQNGMLMSDLLSKLNPDGDSPSVEMLIISAYESPRYSTQGMKERTIQDFQNDVFLKCVKSIRK